MNDIRTLEIHMKRANEGSPWINTEGGPWLGFARFPGWRVRGHVCASCQDKFNQHKWWRTSECEDVRRTCLWRSQGGISLILLTALSRIPTMKIHQLPTARTRSYQHHQMSYLHIRRRMTCKIESNKKKNTWAQKGTSLDWSTNGGDSVHAWPDGRWCNDSPGSDFAVVVKGIRTQRHFAKNWWY